MLSADDDDVLPEPFSGETFIAKEWSPTDQVRGKEIERELCRLHVEDLDVLKTALVRIWMCLLIVLPNSRCEISKSMADESTVSLECIKRYKWHHTLVGLKSHERTRQRRQSPTQTIQWVDLLPDPTQQLGIWSIRPTSMGGNILGQELVEEYRRFQLA